MWSDNLTKPLQGEKFYEIRAQLMKYPMNYHEHSSETMHAIMEGSESVLSLQEHGEKIYNVWGVCWWTDRCLMNLWVKNSTMCFVLIDDISSPQPATKRT